MKHNFRIRVECGRCGISDHFVKSDTPFADSARDAYLKKHENCGSYVFAKIFTKPEEQKTK